MNLNPYILMWLYITIYLKDHNLLLFKVRHLILFQWCLVSHKEVCWDHYSSYLIYINDVATVVSPRSEINMFADDIALYRIIKTPLDYRALQDDVNSIGSLIATKRLEIVYKKHILSLICHIIDLELYIFTQR